MNKLKISTAIPASMSDFKQDKNPHLTSATLKVFHMGKTQDGRYFVKSFADKLAATIGGTPVVARYNEETDDFIGHDMSQSVFGFVPEEPEVWTEEDEDGNSWLYTEVRLFTERQDVGTIAKKIIGHSQSLELNPETLKVNVFYENEEDPLPVVEFIDGDLIGLSVLGVNQEPAFDGAGFFETTTADRIEELISKYLTIPNEIVMETGGNDMDKVIIFETDGITIFKRKGRVYVETTDGTLDDITDALVDGDTTEPEEPGVEPDPDPEEPEEPEVEPEEPGDGEGEDTDPEDGDGDDGSDAEGGKDFETQDAEDTKESEEEEERVEPETEEEHTDTISLSEAEREELNNYRRENKLSIINGYSGFLSEEQQNNFKENMDEFEIDELERELAFVSMQSIKGKPTNKPTFSFTPRNNSKEEDNLTNLIKKNL